MENKEQPSGASLSGNGFAKTQSDIAAAQLGTGVHQHQIKLNVGDPGSPNKNSTISTKFNAFGLKTSAAASKAGTAPLTPGSKGAGNVATNKGTGLETKQPARALNEDSMARLLSSGNPKKASGITQPTKGNAMNSYMAMQHAGSPLRAKQASMAPPAGNQPPVTAGEPQRSLIKGRGQYYKNYQQATMYSNGQTPGLTTQGVTGPITGTGTSMPGTAGMGHDAYNTHSSNYYSTSFAGRHHLQTAAPTGPPGAYQTHSSGQMQAQIPVLPLDGASAGTSEPGMVPGLDAGAFGSRVRSMNQTNLTAMRQNPLASQEGTTSTSLRGSAQHSQLPKPVQKTNVLTGAASTSYSLPVIWAGQYMGLVGYQVQKENQENETRLKQLQELAKQATLKKAEKKKTQLSLPMRGRHMYIADKARDQFMRCEVLKQANEAEEDNLQHKHTRFLDHVAALESQLIHQPNQRLMHAQSLPSEVSKVLQGRSVREFHPLKTKTFKFTNEQQAQRQLSAQETHPSNNQSYSTSGANADPTTAVGFPDYYNNQSSISASNQGQYGHFAAGIPQRQSNSTSPRVDLNQSQAAAAAGKEAVVDSLGSINIITSNGAHLQGRGPGLDQQAAGSAGANKEAKVVDMNQRTNFPLNVQRKKNKNDFYRFLLQQNTAVEGGSQEAKVNNDILIPRSILKKNEVPQYKRGLDDVEDELDEFDAYGSGAEDIAHNEAVVGRQLKGPLLSPKTFSQNFLENQYRSFQIQERANYLMQKEREIELLKATRDHEKVAQIPGVATKIAHLQEETLKIRSQANAQPAPNMEQGKQMQNRDLVFGNEDALAAGARPQVSGAPDDYQKQTISLEGADQNMDKSDEVPVPKLNIKKKIVRTMHEDGFFKTGVDVQEHEEYEFEGTAQEAAEAYRQGQLTAEEIRALLQKKLKDDKIFGYDSFEEFNSKYFKKELVAFEEFHKIRQLKYARVKYNKRNGHEPTFYHQPGPEPYTQTGGYQVASQSDQRAVDPEIAPMVAAASYQHQPKREPADRSGDFLMQESSQSKANVIIIN